MKKLLTAIALIACLILPLSVMAMTSISDNELSAVTGQAGVSISMDVEAQLTINTLAWGDSDGINHGSNLIEYAVPGYTSAGFVGLDNLSMTIHISGRTDGPYSISNGGAYTGWLASLPLTIDVGTNSTGNTLVAIGLPTAHIVLDALTTNIFVSGGTLAGGPSGTIQQLGQIYLSNVDVKMGQATGNTAMPNDAGYVTIGAADATGGTNAGVHIGLNVKIGSIYIGTMSYGNTNIIPGGLLNPVYTSGGYIGMKNFTIGNVTINGGVSIGLHTTDLMSAIYALPYGSSAADLRTCVNIVFDNGTYINIPGAIYGTVLLAQDKNLSATPTGHNELGNFFIGGVTLTLVQPSLTGDPGVVSTIYSNHSNVQISAH
jgi:hypothetical protein